MTRTELIAALEAAEGPSRELDCEIHAFRFGGDTWKHVPSYTESIDAALSFTPEGWAFYRLDQYHGYSNPCAGFCAKLRCHNNPEIGMSVGESRSTPAIALCIANLRALEAQEEA